MMEVVFGLCLFFFLYTWAIYPSLLYVISLLFRADVKESHCSLSVPPLITVIIPVYNGADKIHSKINNLLYLNYATELLEIIIVSDGSDDDTYEVAMSLEESNVRVFKTNERQGKSAAQNLGIAHASNDIVLFTDVDSVMEPDSLTYMLQAFGDEKVGCVGANVMFKESEWQASGSQSIYQRMEEHIRKALSLLGLLISINGSAFLVRKKYFRTLDTDTGDDFIIPLDLALAGYKTVFADRAIVYDFWPGKDLKSEINARRRITLRNFTGLIRRKSLLNPIRHPFLSLSLISHKVLRWLSPILMLLVFAINIFLLSRGVVYEFVFSMQLLIYLSSFIGLVLNTMKYRLPVLGHLGMFLLANVGMAFGLVSLLFGARISTYKT